MDVFRIHSRRTGPLDGSGAAQFGGRWNPAGIPVVYAAAAFEGALLEQLVHANVRRLARRSVASRIVIPDDLDLTFLREGDHPDWHQETTSRRIGGQWVGSGRSLALVVPSFVARPWGRNVMINPAHEDFRRVMVTEVTDVIWDPRLAL